MKSLLAGWLTLASLTPSLALAGEADIRIPPLADAKFLGGSLTGPDILWIGIAVCLLAVA